MSIVEVTFNKPDWLRNPFSSSERGEELVSDLSELTADEARALFKSYSEEDQDAVVRYYTARDNREILRKTLLGGGIIAAIGGSLWFLSSSEDEMEDEDEEDEDDEDEETETE